MNIRKIGVYNKETTYIDQKATYTSKSWRKTSGYKTRGYKNRLKRLFNSKTIKDNLNITRHIKRNRIYHLATPTTK
jgi:hypothetical protein